MNWYAEAMRLIEKASTEQLATAAKIMARKHPASFAKACGLVPITCPGQRHCITASAQGKIRTVKECRAHTGKSLKDAVDAVQGLCPTFKNKVWQL